MPKKGVKSACVIYKNREDKTATIRHRWTPNPVELADIIFKEDGASHDNQNFELSVYHACASFGSNSRKAANAVAVRSLWLDIDAGKYKPYPDQHAAAEAVVEFVRSVGLPQPVFVGSGYGLHVYWPFRDDIEPLQWLPMAERLKALCVEHRLKADAARTADLASILRTPGTINRKIAGAGAPVTCAALVEPYDYEDLRDRLGAGVRGDLRPAPFQAGGEILSGRKTPLGGSTLAERLAASLSGLSRQAAYGEPVAERCAQVRLLRDSGGVLPEPQWYAALGVLAFCEDGDALGHKWSSGYGGYSYAETNERLVRARSLSGATTCAHFQSLDPDRCSGCPFADRINSPVSLGYDNDVQTTSRLGASTDIGEAPAAAPGDAPGVGPDQQTILDLSRRALPGGFVWSGGSLAFLAETPKGGNVEVLVSKHPIHLESLQRGEVAQDRYACNFKVWFPLEGWRDIAISMKKLMGADGISEMFSLGASITDRDLFRRYIIAAVDKLKQENPYLMQYEQFGWKDDDAFLWGRRLYRDGDAEIAVGNEEVKTRAQFLQPRQGGSLAKWSAAADQLFAKDCEPQAFALLASFAAPLMRFHSTDEGGALVSLVSPESGTGKTTALAAAASVWGRYDGVSLNSYDTRVAKGVTLGVLGNLPAIFDEMANRDPEVLKEFVLTFTSGRDRMRGNADGGIRHGAARWQTILITAANRSIVELISSVGETDAPGFRVLEFPTSLPRSLSKSSGDDLKHQLEMNSGWAADEYIAYLTEPAVRQWLPTAVKDTTQEIWERTGLRHEHRFWVRTLGSVSVAAKIVEKLGILSFSPERIMDWAIARITQTEEETERTVTGRSGVSSTSILAEYLNHAIGDTLVVSHPFHPGRRQEPIHKPMKNLTVRYEKQNQRFLIADRPFKMWLKIHNIPAKQLIDDLHHWKIVTRPKVLATLSAGTDLPGGQVICLEVNGAHGALTGEDIEASNVTRMDRKAS